MEGFTWLNLRNLSNDIGYIHSCAYCINCSFRETSET